MHGPVRNVFVPRIVGRKNLHPAQNPVGFRRIEDHGPRGPLRLASRCYSVRELHPRGFIRITGFGKADALAGVGEHARDDRAQDLAHHLVETESTRERQVLMILQTAPEIRQLNRRNRTRHAAILLRV